MDIVDRVVAHRAHWPIVGRKSILQLGASSTSMLFVGASCGDSATMEIRRSALIGRSAASTFDVIEAAERYPEFLPWCENAVILERNDSVVAARITVNYHGVRFAFTTRNPKRRPHWMAIRLEEGPFRRFDGEWNLTELSGDACKIAFTLHYELGGDLLGRLAGRVFDGIANSLVDAYARRAEQAPKLEETSRITIESTSITGEVP